MLVRLILALALLTVPQRIALRIVPGGGDLLTAADITYVGCLGMGSSINTLYDQSKGMTGRQVGGVTHFFIYGTQVSTEGDVVYELADPGSGYSTANCGAKATLVTNWADIYDGKRVTWFPNGDPNNFSTLHSGSLYWHEANQLLYWTWFDYYNQAFDQNWDIGATSLDDDSPVTVTGYGSWRPVATDANADDWYGAHRCMYISNNPNDGKMLCTSSLSGGASAYPWGPSLYGGLTWPTAGTPCCFGNPDLALTDRYANYYTPTNLLDPVFHIDADGLLTGTLKAYPRSSDLYVWEPKDTWVSPGGYWGHLDPSQHGGVGSWTVTSSIGGVAWLPLVHKRGVVFSTTMSGATTQDDTECTLAGHDWYNSAGNGAVFKDSTNTFSGPGPNGSFATISGVMDISSGAAVYVSGDHFAEWLEVDTLFITSSTACGGPSECRLFNQTYVSTTSMTGLKRTDGVQPTPPDATGVTWKADANACSHGCNPTVGNTITGNTTTYSFPAFIIQDPTELAAVKNTSNDYTPVGEVVNLETDLNAPVVAAPDTFQGVQKAFGGMYYDATRNYLFVAAPAADTSLGTTINLRQMAIFVFHINDSAAPVPLMPPMLAFIGAACVLGPIFRRRKA